MLNHSSASYNSYSYYSPRTIRIFPNKIRFLANRKTFRSPKCLSISQQTSGVHQSTWIALADAVVAAALMTALLWTNLCLHFQQFLLEPIGIWIWSFASLVHGDLDCVNTAAFQLSSDRVGHTQIARNLDSKTSDTAFKYYDDSFFVRMVHL